MYKQIAYLNSPWKALWFAYAPVKGRVTLIWTLALAGNLLSYSLPYVLKIMVDLVTQTKTPLTMHDFSTPILLVAGIFIMQEVAFRIANIVEVYAVTRAFKHITQDLFSNLIKRPTSYFEDKFSGDLARRIQQIHTTIIYSINELPWFASWIIAAVVMAGVLLGTTNLLLLYVYLGWFAIFLLTAAPLLWQYYLASEKVATVQAALSGKIIDSLGNVSLVHSFGATMHEENLNGQSVDEVVHAEMKNRWLEVYNKIQQGVSLIILGTSLIYASAYLFTKGNFTVGDFVIVAAVIPSLVGVVWNFGEVIIRATNQFGELSDAVHSLSKEQGELESGELSPTDHAYDLMFENVSFQYKGTDQGVFKDFSLSISQGERVGIVGTSGAGKSTLMKLLLRQYTPQAGAITIGRIPIEKLALSSLRNMVAYVPQDPSLFHRTLFENIRYAKPNATDGEVIKASTQAHAHEFIKEIPEEYNALVGEKGIKLSGGQRQRIALARAILKDAPIIILDEATSSLDSESESLVQEGLEELFKNRTVIAIAHRLSTLRAMDRIVVIEGGLVVESGTPQELLGNEKSIFKRMWEHQKGGFI